MLDNFVCESFTLFGCKFVSLTSWTWTILRRRKRSSKVCSKFQKFPNLKIGQLAIKAFPALRLAVPDDDNKHDGVEDEKSGHDEHRKQNV